MLPLPGVSGHCRAEEGTTCLREAASAEGDEIVQLHQKESLQETPVQNSVTLIGHHGSLITQEVRFHQHCH